MAKVAITKVTSARTGVRVDNSFAAFDASADPDGDMIETNDQRTIVYVKNADAAAHVFHVFSQKTVDGKAVKDQVVSVPAGQEYVFGPYSNNDYGVSGDVYIDIYDASGPTFDADDAVSGGTKSTTGCTVLAISLGAL